LHSKDYRDGSKKTLSDLALPLHVADEFLEKLYRIYSISICMLLLPYLTLTSIHWRWQQDSTMHSKLGPFGHHFAAQRQPINVPNAGA
jgi:hypothetical protein